MTNSVSTDHDPSPYLVPEPTVMARSVGSEIVMLNTKTERYVGLNESGAAIWEACTTLASESEAIDHLMETFDGTDRSTVEVDLRSFVAELEAAGLVTRKSH